METMERINDLTHIGSRSTVTCNTSGRSVVQAIAQCEQLSRDDLHPPETSLRLLQRSMIGCGSLRLD